MPDPDPAVMQRLFVVPLELISEDLKTLIASQFGIARDTILRFGAGTSVDGTPSLYVDIISEELRPLQTKGDE